jgi:hypothetical protein
MVSFWMTFSLIPPVVVCVLTEILLEVLTLSQENSTLPVVDLTETLPLTATSFAKLALISPVVVSRSRELRTTLAFVFMTILPTLVLTFKLDVKEGLIRTSQDKFSQGYHEKTPST